jgi:chromosome partitioning protein
VGKTTLVPQLSAVCRALGWSVVLVDADSQGSSSTWSDARHEKDVPQVPCITLCGRKVHIGMKELMRHSADVVYTGGAEPGIPLGPIGRRHPADTAAARIRSTRGP